MKSFGTKGRHTNVRKRNHYIRGVCHYMGVPDCVDALFTDQVVQRSNRGYGLRKDLRKACLPVCLGSVVPQAALGVQVWKHLSHTREEEGCKMKLGSTSLNLSPCIILSSEFKPSNTFQTSWDGATKGWESQRDERRLGPSQVRMWRGPHQNCNKQYITENKFKM